MGKTAIKIRIIPVILFIVLTLINNGSGQVAIIANMSVPVDTLKKSELLDLYIGDVQNWGDEVPVITLELDHENDVRKSFYSFLDRRPSWMKSIWLKKMLSGEGDPPLFMNSMEAILKKVTSTPGAIGYIHRADVTKDVKILLSLQE